GATYQRLKNGSPVVGAQSNKLTVNSTGNYSVTVTQLSGVSSTTPQTSVGIASLPTAVISAAGSTAFCSGGTLTLSANAGPGFQYQWKRYGVNVANGTGQNLSVNKTGSYRCIVTNASGCSRASNTIDVTVYGLPTSNITALGSTQMCAGDSVGLSSTTSPGLTYQWKKYGVNIIGANSPVYYAKTAGSYKCVVMNSNGCTRSSNTINVNVVCRTSIPKAEDHIKIQSANSEIIISGIDPIDWDGTDIQLVDIAGRTVLKSKGINSNHIQLNGSVQPGIYFVSLMLNGRSYTEKISVK
ncbi:MAG: T9SS type A sorting domain-containing protein, partial [Bacteroidota bacterium]